MSFFQLTEEKEVNDRLRKRVDGTGCYDRIIPNYKKLVEKTRQG